MKGPHPSGVKSGPLCAPRAPGPSDLAAPPQISEQALNYRLGERERLGYRERQDDPEDLRFRRVSLTP